MKLYGLLVLGSVGACSTMLNRGHEIDEARVARIEACKTTEADLVAWFGPPIQRGVANGFPTMNWHYIEDLSGIPKVQMLFVYLNRDKRVLEYQLNPTAALTNIKDKCK